MRISDWSSDVCSSDLTDMINAWFESLDEALTQAIPAQTLSEMKMRDRIAALVQARLDMVKMHREALRRAQSLLALPQNLGKAAKYGRSEEPTSELKSLMRISYAVFCLNKKNNNNNTNINI